VFLAKEDYPDARIMPNGIIIVSTGLLDQSTSDDEIAGLLSHEVAMLCFH
jgi:Zn-dependent protease with chaperone function